MYGGIVFKIRGNFVDFKNFSFKWTFVIISLLFLQYISASIARFNVELFMEHGEVFITQYTIG